MPQRTELHVVLGASGGAGNAIARALHAAGFPVRAVNRSGNAPVPNGFERVAADITTTDGAASAVAGATVVYMAAQPAYHRWPQEFPAMLDRVIDATAHIGAKLVMVDNLYGYGPKAGPMDELTPEMAGDAKGMVRRAMTEKLLAAHRSGWLRVAIGRASDYFGPRADNSTITALAIEPLAEGKPLRWVGKLDVPHSVAYLPDIARAYVTLGTSDKADGEIWILPHGAPVTGRQFLDAVRAAAPTRVRTSVLSRPMLALAAPFHKISRETLAISYQWMEPFVVNSDKFNRVFGPFEATPFDEAVRSTVVAYTA